MHVALAMLSAGREMQRPLKPRFAEEQILLKNNFYSMLKYTVHLNYKPNSCFGTCEVTRRLWSLL